MHAPGLELAAFTAWDFEAGLRGCFGLKGQVYRRLVGILNTDCVSIRVIRMAEAKNELAALTIKDRPRCFQGNAQAEQVFMGLPETDNGHCG